MKPSIDLIQGDAKDLDLIKNGSIDLVATHPPYAAFILCEGVIKVQHKMKTTRERWRGTRYDFYLLAHECLCAFKKISDEAKTEIALTET